MIEPLNIILFTGLILLGIGYFIKRKEGKFFNITGYVFFGIYWIFQAPYFLKIVDTVNAVFCILALPFFIYMAYHDFVSFKKNEDPGCLRFLAGWVFFAGFVYFLVEKTPALTSAVIKICAYQTVWLINLFGYHYGLGEVVYSHDISIPILPTNQGISLILACTGLQSIMIFLGAFIAVKADQKRKVYAFLATVPVIWVLNIIRNVGIIYGDSVGFDVNIAHNYIGKAGSLIALIVLAFVVFKILPELYDNIIGLMDLYNRKTT